MRRFLLTTVVLGAILLGFGTWVTRAPSDPNPVGDAVVVHAGGRGERLDHALDLMADGAAPVLVIMRGAAPTWPQANALCGQADPFEVLCPPPEPDTTIGEALALRDLAADHGWSRVITVTSDYHLRRATYLDGKCSDAEIVGSGAPSNVAWPIFTVRGLREMGGMVQAAIVTC
jgi:uncharacterized SAM-binding protein YcdF (DUF218 family)